MSAAHEAETAIANLQAWLKGLTSITYKGDVELVLAQLELAQSIADESAISHVESSGSPVDRHRDVEGWWDLTEEAENPEFKPRVDESICYLVGRGLLEVDEARPYLVRITPD